MSHNNGAQVRPYDLKGASGIIPKVKANYIDIGTQCNQSKDAAKNACEQVFRFLSDKVRRGENCQMELPYVGTFIVRSGIAAVNFKNEVSEGARGKTARGHVVGNLFASAVNRQNLKLADGTQRADIHPVQTGGGIRVTDQAENWMRSNLNISVQEIQNRQPRLQSAKPGSQQINRQHSMRAEDLRHKVWNNK